MDIRDTKELENGEIKTTSGSKAYSRILELLSEKAEEYIVSGEIVGTRIYAPSILIVKNKEIVGIVSGKSYLESEEEQDAESYKIILEHLQKYQSNTCSIKEGC